MLRPLAATPACSAFKATNTGPAASLIRECRGGPLCGPHSCALRRRLSPQPYFRIEASIYICVVAE